MWTNRFRAQNRKNPAYNCPKKGADSLRTVRKVTPGRSEAPPLETLGHATATTEHTPRTRAKASPSEDLGQRSCRIAEIITIRLAIIVGGCRSKTVQRRAKRPTSATQPAAKPESPEMI